MFEDDRALNFHAGGEYRYADVATVHALMDSDDRAEWIEFARSPDPATDKMVIKLRDVNGAVLSEFDYHGCLLTNDRGL